MEIPAIGLSGSNALTGSPVAGANDPAFAAVLGALGAKTARPCHGQFLTTNSGTKEASPSVAPPATAKGIQPTGADLRLHLLSSGAAIRAAPLDLPDDRTLARSGDGELLAAPLVVYEAPASSVPIDPQAENPVPGDELQEAGMHVHQGFVEGLVPSAPAAPGAGLKAEDVAGPGDASPPTSSAAEPAQGSSPMPDVAMKGETDMGISPPPPSPGETATLAESHAAQAILASVAAGPLAAAAQSAQMQASPSENSRYQTIASRAERVRPVAGEAGLQPASTAIDSSVELAEKFTRGLPDTLEERRQPLANTGGATPSSNQTANPPTGLTSQAATLASVAPGSQPSVPTAVAPLAAPAPVPVPAAPVADAPFAPAERHPVMAFRADKVAREMGVEIARRVSSGGQELVIRLDPAELGRISIRMSVNEQGQLRAIVAADAPSVIEAIRSDISELSRTLEQAGVRTDSQSFRFDRGGSGDPGGQWHQRYQQPNSSARPDEHNGVPVDETGSYRPLATNGRINMMA